MTLKRELRSKYVLWICAAGAYLLRYVKIAAQNFRRKIHAPKAHFSSINLIDEKYGLGTELKEYL